MDPRPSHGSLLNVLAALTFLAGLAMLVFVSGIRVTYDVPRSPMHYCGVRVDLLRPIIPAIWVGGWVLSAASVGWGVVRGVLWPPSKGRLARVQRRKCWQCGYDVRATLERCPECGLAEPLTLPPEFSWPSKRSIVAFAIAVAVLVATFVASMLIKPA